MHVQWLDKSNDSNNSDDEPELPVYKNLRILQTSHFSGPENQSAQVR